MSAAAPPGKPPELPSAAAPTARRPLLALSTTMTAQILGSLCLAVPPVLAPVVAPALGFGADRVGLFVGLAYCIAMISGLASGRGVQRLGAIGVTQLAMLTFALGMMLLPIGTGVAIAASAIVLGIGYGVLNPSAAPLLQVHSPPNHRGLYFSIKQAAVPIGVALAGLLMPPALASLGWRSAVQLVALVCFVHLALLFLARPLLQGRRAAKASATKACAATSDVPAATATATAPAPPPPSALPSALPSAPAVAPAAASTRSRQPRWLAAPGSWALARVLRDPPLRRVALASFAYAFTQLAYTTFLVSYLKLELGQSLALAAGILAVSQVASTLARVGWGAIADHWMAPDRLLGWLGIGSAIAFLMLGALGYLHQQYGTLPTSWVMVASLACAVTSMSWNGVYFAELARRTTPATLASTAGASQFLTFCGSMTGPVVFSQMLASGVSYGLTYALMLVLPLAAGVSLLRHPTPTPAT